VPDCGNSGSAGVSCEPSETKKEKKRGLTSLKLGMPERPWAAIALPCYLRYPQAQVTRCGVPLDPRVGPRQTATMSDHETHRKIIRQWMALPADKRQTAEQATAFAEKAAKKKRVGAQPPRSARADHGLAVAALPVGRAPPRRRSDKRADGRMSAKG
jgi:hypothetical protein